MVERVKSTRRLDGRRPMGRPRGGEAEWKRVAKAAARKAGSGQLPDELLRTWADEGYMIYASRKGKPAKMVELAPADRISCAKGCAQFYKAPLRIPGEEKPVVLTLDENLLAAMVSSGQPRMLETLRDLLLDLQAGRVGPTGQSAADPNRYAATLRPSSPTAGRA